MKKILPILLLLLFVSVVFSNAQLCTYVFQDSAISFQTSKGEKVLLLDKQQFITAKSFSEKAISRYGSFHFKQKNVSLFYPLPGIQIQQFENSFFLSGNLSNGKFSLPFQVGIFLNDTFPMRYWMSVKVDDTLQKLSSVTLTLNTDAVHFYGFGEQFSHFDFSGKSVRCFTEENGIGRGDMPVSKLTKMIGVKGEPASTYFPMPKFFTEKNQAFSVTPTDVIFDFTQNGKMSIEVGSCHLGKCLFNLTADTASELLKPVFHQLPDWACGSILGLQGGKERVEKIADEAIAAGNPVRAVWIQDWVGRRKVSFGSRLWWKWEADTVLYPDLKNWIHHMNEKGVKVLGYINPFFIEESRWFGEAVAKNFLVKNRKGKNYKIKAGGFDAYMLDLANPAACDWMKGIIITQMIETGFSGWMADFAEWLPLDARLHNGFNGKTFHNFYAVAWARINREAAQEAGVDDSLVIFHRSGNEGSQRYAKMFWTGDQTPDFGDHDGLPSAVRGVLTSAASGVLYNHTDIGGYTNVDFGNVRVKRNRETLYRWAEFAVFTPFFRTHEGLKPEKNMQVYSDAEAVNFFAQMGRLHYSLREYMKQSVMDENGKVQPLIRPLYFVQGFENFQFQFFLGKDLLVAPVVEPRKQTIEVKLPEGEWQFGWKEGLINFNAATRIATVHVPFGKPAVFLRKGGKAVCCE